MAEHVMEENIALDCFCMELSIKGGIVRHCMQPTFR